jgi:iron complex outermembrane receptor protein
MGERFSFHANAGKGRASFGVMITMIATGAAGQSAALEEVVVTATKRAENLSNVPISVAAYTSETMDRQGIRSAEDLARLTPGVSFSRDTFGSGGDTSISIRGISSDSGAATTGVYIDDTAVQIRKQPQTAFGAAFPEIFDIERVEVLRGPQGTLFGAGAQGGVVRFITPTPSLTDQSIYARSEAAFTENGDPSYEVGGAFGAPVVEDKLGVRVSAYYRRTGGFVDRRPVNTATPNSTERYEDVNSSETTAYRASLLFAPTDAIRINPSIFYQRQVSDDSGAFWGPLSDESERRFASGYVLEQTGSDRFYIPSLKATIDLGLAELTSVTSYFERKANGVQDYTNVNTSFIFDRPYPFVPGWKDPGDARARQESMSQELRLASTDPDARVRWTVGAFYTDTKQDESFFIEGRTVGQILPIQAIFGIPLSDGRYLFKAWNDVDEEQYAAFGQVDVELVERLTATAGLRYGRTEFAFRRTVGGPLNYTGSGPEITSNSGREVSKPLTPKFGLSFQADDNHLYYASMAKGFRVGGVNPPLFASCAIQNAPTSFGPDTTWSYEIGSKNRLFDGTLRLEQSAFYIKWEDIQQFVLAGCAGNGFRDNLGSAVSKGFDFQAVTQLSDNLTVGGAVGYVSAKLEKTIESQGLIITRSGDSLPGSPWQLALNIDYQRPAFGDGEFYVHADARHNSHNNGGNVTAEDPRALGYDPSIEFDPAITEVNLRMGVRLWDGVDASLFVNNLFDKAPLLNKGHDTETSPLFYYSTIRPRTIGVTVSVRK